MNKQLFARIVASFALGAALLLTGCEDAASDPNAPPSAPSQDTQDPYVPMPMPLPGGPPGVFIVI